MGIGSPLQLVTYSMMFAPLPLILSGATPLSTTVAVSHHNFSHPQLQQLATPLSAPTTTTAAVNHHLSINRNLGSLKTNLVISMTRVFDSRFTHDTITGCLPGCEEGPWVSRANC